MTRIIVIIQIIDYSIIIVSDGYCDYANGYHYYYSDYRSIDNDDSIFVLYLYSNVLIF